jgi:hypothetical protein
MISTISPRDMEDPFVGRSCEERRGRGRHGRRPPAWVASPTTRQAGVVGFSAFAARAAWPLAALPYRARQSRTEVLKVATGGPCPRVQGRNKFARSIHEWFLSSQQGGVAEGGRGHKPDRFLVRHREGSSPRPRRRGSKPSRGSLPKPSTPGGHAGCRSESWFARGDPGSPWPRCSGPIRRRPTPTGHGRPTRTGPASPSLTNV